MRDRLQDERVIIEFLIASITEFFYQPLLLAGTNESRTTNADIDKEALRELVAQGISAVINS